MAYAVEKLASNVVLASLVSFLEHILMLADNAFQKLLNLNQEGFRHLLAVKVHFVEVLLAFNAVKVIVVIWKKTLRTRVVFARRRKVAINKHVELMD